MTHRIGNILVLEPEPDDKCELCGAIAETRPSQRRGRAKPVYAQGLASHQAQGVTPMLARIVRRIVCWFGNSRNNVTMAIVTGIICGILILWPLIVR